MEYLWRSLKRRRLPKVVAGAIAGMLMIVGPGTAYVRNIRDLLLWMVAAALQSSPWAYEDSGNTMVQIFTLVG